MNWISTIRRLLGRFWSVVFAGHDFLSGMESTMALSSQIQQAGHDEWAAGQIYDSDGRYADSMPFVVYIDIESMGRPAVSYADAINGDAALGASEAGGYAARSMEPIPHPAYLADHVAGYTVTLLDGFDYTVEDQQFLFHVDLSALNLQIVPLTGSDGAVHAYYKLFGWTAPVAPVHDAATSFHGTVLNPVAGIVWDMHQRGATVYSAKKLLAGVTGSVVCDNTGIVTDIWIEQETRCMCVYDTVYHAPVSAPVGLKPDGTALAVGDYVEAGQVLFGDMRMYDSQEDIPAQAIPGMHVMTDAGEFVAPNETVTLGLGQLGLQGDTDALAAYRSTCSELAADPKCPCVNVPATHNPMLFLMRRFRRGRAVAVSLVARNLAAVSAAIACLRRCTDASGMVNVYVQAESDTLSVNSSFTADAGMAAVATVATVTIKEMFAEAELSL